MLSVITPHYSTTNPYVVECYESLKRQTMQDWEWVVVPNNGGELPAEIRSDERVRIVEHDSDKIGALKRFGFDQTQGDILVELDADDMITPDCLAELQAAFEDKSVSFVHSNSARFEDKTWKPCEFGAYWGWKKRPFVYEGHELVEMLSFEATPHAMRMIYWCPNHVRAWRASDYKEIGGHDPELSVIDDYDLLCRTYLHGKEMKLIDKCLYLYRKYPTQATRLRNPAIQAKNKKLYSHYIIPMAQEWCRREGLPKIDLGGAISKPRGYISLDTHDADVVCDLREGIPYDDNSVGIVRAYDLLEHLPDQVFTMNEIWRVLAPGGWLLASIPSTDGRGAFQDPTHVSFWNENSLEYYTNPKFQRYVPAIKARFQVSRVMTWFPSEWHKKRKISYVDAQLMAYKGGFRAPGECLWGIEGDQKEKVT